MNTKPSFAFPLVDTVLTGFAVCALALVGGVALVVQSVPSVLA